jgi:pentatricopeptide repeat protein
MYTASGNVEIGRRVFDKIYQRILVSWNAIIKGYVRNNLWDEVLAFFFQMKQGAINTNKFKFPLVIKACERLLHLEHGKEIHAYIIGGIFDLDAIVEIALIDMYA